MIAPFAPRFGPAIFSPRNAPASLPSISRTPVEQLGVSTHRAWRMFPTEVWDLTPTLGWDFSPEDKFNRYFSQFSGIGTLLD